MIVVHFRLHKLSRPEPQAMVVFSKSEMEEERSLEMTENTPRSEIKKAMHGSRVSKVVSVSAWPHIFGQFPENTLKYPLSDGELPATQLVGWQRVSN